MSNRQERIARKKAQREGKAIFVHIKPVKRVLNRLEHRPRPIGNMDNPPGTGIRATRRRKKLYGENA